MRASNFDGFNSDKRRINSNKRRIPPVRSRTKQKEDRRFGWVGLRWIGLDWTGYFPFLQRTEADDRYTYPAGSNKVPSDSFLLYYNKVHAWGSPETAAGHEEL